MRISDWSSDVCSSDLRPDCGLELVAINDLADAKSNALLFKRDSVHGAYKGSVQADGNDLIIDGKRIKVTAERDPANLPHAANGIDIALECTGFFTDRESARSEEHTSELQALMCISYAVCCLTKKNHNRSTQQNKP